MVTPRSSSSSGDYAAQDQILSDPWSKTLSERRSNSEEREKEWDSRMLPRWQTEQSYETRKLRAPRLFRVHLGWLVAGALFVLLMLQSGSGWKNQLQRISPSSSSIAHSVAPPALDVSGVTIVSAFFLVVNGKKHTSDGELLQLQSG